MSTLKNLRLLPKIDSAIIISMATGFAYLCPFLYQYSYFRCFQIPSSLIAIDLNTIMQYWAGFLATIGFISLTIYSINRWTKNLNKFKSFLIKGELFVIVICIFSSYVTGTGFDWIFFVFLLGFTVLLFITAFLGRRSIDNGTFFSDSEDDQIIEKINKMSVEERKRYREDFIRGALYGLITIISIGCLGGSYLKGQADARNEEDFYVFANKPNTVVIKFYEDRVICKQID